MFNPYVILGVIVLWGVSLFGVGKWQYGVGSEHERVAWQARANAELVAANAEIKAVTEKYRKLEQESAARVATIGADYEKAKKELDDRRRSDARAAPLKLRVPARACNPSGPPVPDAGSGPSLRDATEIVELPREVGSDLRALANDADEVALQLAACQAVVVSDRAGVGG